MVTILSHQIQLKTLIDPRLERCRTKNKSFDQQKQQLLKIMFWLKIAADQHKDVQPEGRLRQLGCHQSQVG